jgi:hypothetical protein
MVKQLIIMFSFFNVDLIRRSLESILASKYNPDVEVDILILENSSKYSAGILELSRKYNIEHYKANDNYGSHIFTKFYMDYKHILEAYDLIAVTESDVIIEPNAIQETITLLTRSDLSNAGNCGIQLSVDAVKYNELLNDIKSWICTPYDKGDYCEGVTGFQFINFKKDHYFDFFECIISKRLCNPVVLGSSNYNGPSDSNLIYFNKKIKRKRMIVTKYNSLEHIGWETYLSKNYEQYKEYLDTKDEAIKTGKDRNNIPDISVIQLTKIN